MPSIPNEIVNALKQVVINHVSLSKEELLRETAKNFGFARIGNNVEQAMTKGIGAIEKGLRPAGVSSKGFVRGRGTRYLMQLAS